MKAILHKRAIAAIEKILFGNGVEVPLDYTIEHGKNHQNGNVFKAETDEIVIEITITEKVEETEE